MLNWRSVLSGIGLFLLVAFLPTQTQAAITHIQSKLNNSHTYVSSQNVVMTSSVTSGNLIVVAVSAYTGTNADITTVTDNKGNTYTRAIRNPVIANGQHHISIWYAKNVIGGSSFTVTATPASSSYVSIAAHEYSNASIGTVLDQTTGNNGSTAAATSSNTAPTTQSDEMLFGAFMHEAASNPAATAGTGFTKRQSLTNGTFEPLITEDKNVTSTGAYAATLTWSSALSWRGIEATFIASSSGTPTPNTPTLIPSATPVPTETPMPTPTATLELTITPTPSGTPSPTPTIINTVLESFEGASEGWQTTLAIAGTGSVTQSSNQVFAGSNSARANTTSANSSAAVQVAFSDPAANHAWQERPGTFNWQRARVYVPSSTINQLSGSEYITLGGMWASSGGHAWYLRVKQNGQLYVAGNKSDGTLVEFNVYGTIPTDQWVDLEMGLQSQNGPGVKRAFAFALNGHFYGWYRQGRMDSENYDRIAYGILDTNSADSLEVYVDDWYNRTTGSNPTGPDLRSTESLQNHNFQDGSGENVQIDWSTWQNDILISSEAGIYSNSDRLQAGHNIDKMPDLTDGWAEIEIGWSGAPPPTTPNSYFGPMVGFHKEINREENLEVIPIGNGNGTVDLALEAWTNGGPTIFARWAMPEASIGRGSHIPEPGDIIRTKWHMVDASNISVQASFFDASANQWYTDVINGTYNISNLSGGVNLNDSFHTASSITIDTTYYSIRRYQVGVLSTYSNPNGATPTPTPSPTASPTASPTMTPTPSPTPGSGLQTVTRSVSASDDDVNQDGSTLTTNSAMNWLGNASSVSSSYAGLRFNNITIPRNATITGAYLRVYSSQSQWLTINMNIAAENTANSGPFDDSNPPSSKSLTAASVNHSSNTNWAASTWYNLDDIKTVVQEVVNRGDWNSGNSMSFILKGTSTGSWGRKFIQSYDGTSANAPQLVITYQ